jgi:hypothetical protein
MTIQDAIEILFYHFQNNNNYNHTTNLKDLILVQKENADWGLETAVLDKALEEMEKNKIVTAVKTPNSSISTWVLMKPINQWEQHVTISGEVGAELARIVNAWCKQTNDTKSLVNPINITGNDIYKLLVVVNKLMENAKSE